MACFTGPVAAAAVTAAIRHSLAKKADSHRCAIPWSVKLKWLEKLFWGGALLLALEHIWHGEIGFSFPFLTAVKNGETAAMLEEIATVGSAMTGLIIAVWIAMVLIAERIVERSDAAEIES